MPRIDRINTKERDRYIRALERNRDGLTAQIEETREEIATLRVFVRELMHAVERLEKRQG